MLPTSCPLFEAGRGRDALGIPDARIVQGPIERENLSFEVRRTVNRTEKEAQLIEILEQTSGSGIVYAATVREVNDLHGWLNAKGISAVRYHGRLGVAERRRAQEEFMSGRCPLIVATNAFGLGVDKPDVRFVVHWNFPESVENYYQEAGRAGRDGAPARCTLFYRLEDKQVRSFFLGGKHPRTEEVRRLLRVLLHSEGGSRPRAIPELAAASDLSERRVRVICSALESVHVLTRRRAGRQLARVMSEAEIQHFVRSVEAHCAADHERLQAIMRYGEMSGCRMQFFREYFGEVPGTPCGHCDNCLHPVAAPTIEAPSPVTGPDQREPKRRLPEVGASVRHARFGVGEVMSAVGVEITVSFPRYGTRRVLGAYLSP